MKMKKVAAQCRAAGMARLFDREDSDGCVQQWITNGAAVYPVTGMPYLEVEHLAALFELTDKQMEKMSIRRMDAPVGMDLSDSAPGEVRAEIGKISIVESGKLLVPVTAGGVTRLINRDFLDPIWAEYDDMDLYLRRMPDGTPYFAVKAGLMLVGVVMPLTDIGHIAGQLMDMARRMPDEDYRKPGGGGAAGGGQTAMEGPE